MLDRANMNQKKLQMFINAIEKMHENLGDENAKLYLCNEFKSLKEKHFQKKETNKQNVYEDLKKFCIVLEEKQLR